MYKIVFSYILLLSAAGIIANLLKFALSFPHLCFWAFLKVNFYFKVLYIPLYWYHVYIFIFLIAFQVIIKIY